MLFRLAMPADWRNRMPSTPPPVTKETPKVEDTTICGDTGPPLQLGTVMKPSTGNFWSDVGLRSYAQMDFNLQLSLDHRRCRRSTSAEEGDSLSTNASKKCKKNKTKRSMSPPPTLGGLLYRPDVNEFNKQMESDSDETGNDKCNGDDEGECAGDDEIVPPNALCLISILRMTLDCPIADIRKQAANVLFLLRVC